MELNLIVAYCKKNNGIGNEKSIPWYLKSELKYFKEITSKKEHNLSNIVIMGRKTWDSLPKKPLQNRINIILSNNNNNDYKKKIESNYKDTYVINDIEKYLESLKNQNQNIFVIGGSQIYKHVLDLSESNNLNFNLNLNLYITEIYNEFNCDTYYPKIDNNLYSLTYVSNFKEENEIYFRHKIFKQTKNLQQNEIWVNNEEYQYLNTLSEILEDGQENIDRTNVGTKSIFGKQYKYNLRDTFPALTTKRIFFRGIFEELMLYLTGKTDNTILNNKKINIWDGNTTR